MKDSKLTRQAKDQTSLSTSDKTKPSRKRKRTTRDASLDAPADVEVDATVEPEPRKNKKRNSIHRTYPDPTTDEALSQQSCRGLSYAYERCQGVDNWKFNKARQNWLLRNVWSEQAVPESYVPLVIEYLAGIKGGAREKLVGVCTSKLSTSEDEPMHQGTQSLNGSTNVGSTIKQQSTSRALSILNALRKDSENNEFS